MISARYIGIANQEVVLVDKIDDVVRCSWRQFGDEGVVASKLRLSSKPLFISAVSVLSVDQVSSDHFRAALLKRERHFTTVLMM